MTTSSVPCRVCGKPAILPGRQKKPTLLQIHRAYCADCGKKERKKGMLFCFRRKQ